MEPDRRTHTAGEIIASIGYVGSDSVRGFAFLDINASQIPGSGDEGRPLFAEFGRTTTTREVDGRTHSIYHALQATLNRRFKDGLLLKSAYTWSKAIDEAPYSDWTEFRYNAASVFYRNRSLADHDIPHNFQLGALYELPFGKEKKWAPQVSAYDLPGWQLGSVFATQLGRPFIYCLRLVVEHAATSRRPIRSGERRDPNGSDGTYRYDGVRARHRSPVRQCGSQHCGRWASRTLIWGCSVFKVRESTCGSAWRFSATNTPHFQPERQRQQCELWARAVHADRGCMGDPGSSASACD